MVMQEAGVIKNNGEIDDRKQLLGFVKKFELERVWYGFQCRRSLFCLKE